MKHSVLFAAALLIFLQTPAFACAPPVPSPAPAEITALYNMDAEENSLTPEQHARLDEYEVDQNRISVLWAKLNPCEMYPAEVKAFEALPPEEKQAAKTEMQALTKKWAPPPPPEQPEQ